MATSIKHIVLLLSFLLLCFLSARTEGRRLKEELERKYPDKVEPKQVKERDDLRGAEGDEVLIGMDYTPASRKSPVHN